MSIKFTKTFEINENGDCYQCKCRKNALCQAFDLRNIFTRHGFAYQNNWEQCQECKDFLAENKLWNADIPVGYLQSNDDHGGIE